jgi:hypothetical protein
VIAWTCHAKPARLGGKTCGHQNTTGGSSFRNLVCCDGCGATKIASDDRLARETNKERTSTP